MVKERRLGKGLDALIGSEPPLNEGPVISPEMQGLTREVETHLLKPNRYQPRMEFDEADLNDLANSLDTEGILQPILVRRQGQYYEIIAGERRWRAAQIKGLKKVPVVIKDVDDRKALELALIENIHRRDLNPIEKARAFRELQKQMGATQDEMAGRIGMDRSTIANFIRLMDLPVEIQECVSRGTITMGHARALLSLSSQSQQVMVLKRIIQEDLSVRSVERLIATFLRRERKSFGKSPKDAYIQDIEDKLTGHFGSKVTLHSKGKGGTITIEYYSNEQFNGIIQKLGVTL